MDENDKCKFKLYRKRDTRAPVFISDFAQGQVQSKDGDLKFECYKKEDSREDVGSDATRQLVATNGRLNYSGSSSQSALKYFVGVRNKETGKMKLYDSVLFRLKPELKLVDSNESKVNPKSYWEGMNELTQNFGSKAKKRALNTMQKCTVDSSVDKSLTINESLLRSSPDRSTIDETYQPTDYLPPQYRNAAEPSEVFDINCIISPEEDNALNQEAQDLLMAPESKLIEKRSTFCKYVASRFYNVNALKAKFLVYYNYLISFQHLKYADIRKKDPAPHIPNPLKKNILDKYTLSSSDNKGKVTRSCPSQMKDKLLAYILVLALFIDDFKINLDEIHRDLNNVGVTKLKTIAEVLGCHAGKSKMGEESVYCAELRIPLSEIAPKFSKKPSARKF